MVYSSLDALPTSTVKRTSCPVLLAASGLRPVWSPATWAKGSEKSFSTSPFLEVEHTAMTGHSQAPNGVFKGVFLAILGIRLGMAARRVSPVLWPWPRL